MKVWWCEEHGRAYRNPYCGNFCELVEMQLVPADARWYEEGSEALPPSKWIGQ